MRTAIRVAVTLALLVRVGYGQGSVLLVGGGSENYNDWSDAPYRWLVQHAPNGHILVLHYSTASTFLPAYFQWLGAASATNLIIPSTASANDTNTVKSILACDGIFLRGGDQWQYISLWRGTLAETALRQVFQRGGVIGGTSAGMAVLTEVIFDARLTSVEPRDALRDPLTSGISFTENFLGFVPGVLGDTHFFERGRLGRLLAMLSVYREHNGRWITGVGVDYNSALAVDSGGEGEVMGAGTVTVLRATGETTYSIAPGMPLAVSNMRMDLLTPGYQINLSSGEMRSTVSALPYSPTDVHCLASSLILDGSGSAASWTSANGSLDHFVATLSSSPDTVGVISRMDSPPGLASVGTFLTMRGVAWRLLSVGEATRNDTALAALCGRCKGFVFVSNNAESLAGWFTSTALGTSLYRQIQENSPVLMLSSDCTLSADSAVGRIESDPDGAYYGTLTRLKGLALTRGIEVMPRLYEDADSVDNRFSGLFWGMGRSHPAYGLLLDGGTSAHLSSAGLLSISGVTPAIVVDGRRVTSCDFPTFHAHGRPNPRVGAALVGAALDVVRNAQTIDLSSGEILGVRTPRPAPPENLFLSQGYPNPFNPSTRLQFRIPRRQPVRLSVYDLTGKEIVRLLDGPVDPGTYSVTFDGSGLASGAYFCRLTSPLFAQTRKLLLIR
jgi:cyanophycinase